MLLQGYSIMSFLAQASTQIFVIILIYIYEFVIGNLVLFTISHSVIIYLLDTLFICMHKESYNVQLTEGCKDSRIILNFVEKNLFISQFIGAHV